MKKYLVFLFVIIIGLNSLVAQSSVDSLIKERKTELKNIENADLPDKEKISRMKEIDLFYKDLIEKAIESDRPSFPNPAAVPNLGTEVVLNSPNGSFKTKNYRKPTENSAAYKEVVIANAQANLMNAVANSVQNENGKITSTDPYNTGFEGAFFNRYRNQRVDITIIGIDNSYKKVLSIAPSSVQYLNLLPGTYEVIAKGDKDSNPGRIIITVNGLKDFRGDDGKDYVFGANIGR